MQHTLFLLKNADLFVLFDEVDALSNFINSRICETITIFSDLHRLIKRIEGVSKCENSNEQDYEEGAHVVDDLDNHFDQVRNVFEVLEQDHEPEVYEEADDCLDSPEFNCEVVVEDD